MNTEHAAIRVLYIEDEPHNRSLFEATFQNDFHIITAPSATEGLEILKEDTIHILITDQRMPEITGIEFLSSIVDTFPDPVRILLTGYTELSSVVEAVNQGHIFYFATKPWDADNLKTIIIKAYEYYQKQQKDKEVIEKLTKINEGLEFHLRQKLIS
ncbi:response regulator [Xanthocytophaga agilis]|uniref:Response regulator n=1 Tax=Xanthocytophaga agilis TaxID=3048010 RepID=A0AAE3R2F1_9BACT|nr:response regulator [Xanthocytophaga agilis]MDJ1502601.1 response regulator [Xanthocytophaga agilis]